MLFSKNGIELSRKQKNFMEEYSVRTQVSVELSEGIYESWLEGKGKDHLRIIFDKEDGEMYTTWENNKLRRKEKEVIVLDEEFYKAIGDSDYEDVVSYVANMTGYKLA